MIRAGPVDAVARRKARAQKDRRLVPVALREDAGRRMRRGRRRALAGKLRLLDRLAAAARLDLDRLDLDVLLRTDEAEALLMRDLEQRPHAAQARERNGERAVGAGIAEMRLRHSP